MAANTFYATYQGTTDTRTSRTVTYTHAAMVRNAEGEVFAARWSKSLQGALAKLPNGWEARRVATVEVTTQAPAQEATAEVTLAGRVAKALGVTGQAERIGNGVQVRVTVTRQQADDLLVRVGRLVLSKSARARHTARLLEALEAVAA